MILGFEQEKKTRTFIQDFFWLFFLDSNTKQSIQVEVSYAEENVWSSCFQIMHTAAKKTIYFFYIQTIPEFEETQRRR